MENTDSSTFDLSPSDLEHAVTTIQQHKGLIGYRNLLSYASALGVKVFSKTSVDIGSWTQIGTGSYSTTWKANILTEQGLVVAVKQPNASFTRASTDVENSVQHEGLASIIQELRILGNAKLRTHPNLPHVLGVFFREEKYPDGIRPCVIFELAMSDLRQYLTSKGVDGISPSEMMGLASNAADGIGALHACGLVHGDVKPDNILLFMRDGALTGAVGDLGTCGAPNQISGVINGSLWYCAPEYLSGSPFADHANKPSRDVYNYGLLLWSMLTYCKENPFPRGQQYDIQHDDEVAVRSLLERIPSNATLPNVRNLILHCVRSNPGNRPSIFEVSWTLDPASNMRELTEVTDAIDGQLLTNPANPRVKTLSQMSLPTHLIGKLRREYGRFTDPVDGIRCTITLAGLYSGAIGPRIDGPWNVVAKIQWLLQAIKLGSHATVTSIMHDENAIRLLEEFGPELLKIRHQSFDSPDIDRDALLCRLEEFALMPDIDSANVLVWLGGNLDFDEFTKRLDEQSAGHRVDSDVIGDGDPRRIFTLNRGADLELVDSDAYDLNFVGASEISRSVYNNSLEDFIMLAEAKGMQPKDHETQSHMAAAIFHGSLDIVRYLVHRYGVEADDSWEGITHLNHSILYRRSLIVEFFLEYGAMLEEASGEKLSGLHLVSRHDDPELITMLCEHVRERGNLSAILESRTSGGPASGWTAAYTAMCCRSWKNLEILLRYGADPNCTTGDDCPRMIEMAVRPLSPAAPISILQMLLEKGARLNDELGYRGSPLMWAIESSNALAVFHLLLYGAAVADIALEDAHENADEETVGGEALPVQDEDGEECEEAGEHMCEAASLIVKLLHIGRARQQGWKQLLQETIETPSQGWRGKMWVKNTGPPSYMIEVQIPDRG